MRTAGLAARRFVPRKLREEVGGGIHHVWARGNARQDIYVDDHDRRTYLSALGGVVEVHHWRCLAYCLMSNHVHVLVETPEPNLAAGMQRLQGAYAQAFNRRHERSGHLFQGRFGSGLIRDDRHLWAVAGYIALNPVSAGLCSRPERWPWSSHAAVLGAPAPDWLDVARLLWFFGGHGGAARAAYAGVVEKERAGLAEARAVAGAARR